MHREESAIHDASQGEQIKRIHEHVVNFLVKFVEALASKVEKGGHLSAFVISPDKVDSFGKINFECVQENQDFNTEAAPINEIA